MLSSLSISALVLAAVAVSSEAHSARQAATVFSNCVEPNTVALTFDDGPYIYESEIVSVLDQNGIKGTFFVNGNNYDCIYDESIASTVQATFAAGHQFASHTWSHPDLTTLSADQIQDQMWRVEQALQKIIGVVPAFMRPPYGNYNPTVEQVAASRNQSLVLWDFDSGDSTGSPPSQSESAYDQIANQHPNNLLALNHETVQTTATEVLPHAISVLQAKGYKFATVAECLGMQPYQSIGSPSQRDGSWTC